jgi:hypothetical protein
MRQEDGEADIEDHYDLYSSPNNIWVINSKRRWAEHVARMVMRQVVAGVCKGCRQSEIARGRWKNNNNTKIDFNKKFVRMQDKFVVQDADNLWAFVNTVMKLRIP